MKVFVALPLDSQGNPRHLRMQVTPNIKQASVRKFAQSAFAENIVIRSDDYRSYIPALKDFYHEHKTYDPNSGLLHWLHIMTGNAKAFILVPIMACQKTICSLISTNFVSVSAVAPLASRYLIVSSSLSVLLAG